jgi:hypothetical protein
LRMYKQILDIHRISIDILDGDFWKYVLFPWDDDAFYDFFRRGWKHQPGPGGRSKAFLHLCVSTQFGRSRLPVLHRSFRKCLKDYLCMNNSWARSKFLHHFAEHTNFTTWHHIICWDILKCFCGHTLIHLRAAGVTPVQSRSQQGFCVVPCMDFSGSHVLMESCPASVLKRLELYTEPYKGKTAKHGRRRRVILDRLKMLGCVTRRVGCNYPVSLPVSFLSPKAPRPQGRMWSFQHVRRGVPIGRNSKSLLSVQMADPHLNVDFWGQLVPCEQVWDEIAMGQNLCFLPCQNLTSGWTSTIALHFDVHQGVDWETDHREQL